MVDHIAVAPEPMPCRSHCGACCIAISISSPLPGLPNGKPAGMRCPHLLADYRCALFNDPSRPAVCHDFQASPDVCGRDRDEAVRLISWWEAETGPSAPGAV